MSTVTVNINALYTLYLNKIVEEFGRKTKPENFAVAEFSTLDLERGFKIRDLENLVNRDTKVIIQHSSGQLYLVDTQVLKEPVNIIKQCGDLNKFYNSMHRKLMNAVKEEEHKQKFVDYGALHLTILRFFIYTHGSKQVARIISNKMIMGQNLIARLGFKFLFGRSLIYQKIEKFRQVPMELNDMELMTVLSFALVYNGQELKKYQQMLIKENISLDSFVYQLIKVEQTEENTKQDNTKQNDQDNTKQNKQDNTKQNKQDNTKQNKQDNTKQNDSETTPKQNTENKIATLAVLSIASLAVVGYLIISFIKFAEHAFTTVIGTITSIKILILVAVIALAYIFRDVPLYWITVKALQEQKKQQQDDRQNRDRRDRFNENREHRNYYKQKYQEHEQKYNQLVNQKIETLPRLVIVST
jgi:flagellum-specific peptidoglycan hydrolase FlgJ